MSVVEKIQQIIWDYIRFSLDNIKKRFFLLFSYCLHLNFCYADWQAIFRPPGQNRTSKDAQTLWNVTFQLASHSTGFRSHGAVLLCGKLRYIKICKALLKCIE